MSKPPSCVHKGALTCATLRENIYLRNMRTIAESTFRPREHLQPVLGFLSGGLSHEQEELDREAAAAIRNHSLKRGSRDRRLLATELRTALRRRVLSGAVGQLTVG